MNTRYASTSSSIRTIAATAAVATVVALFDFVAGLGDAGAEALAQAQSAQQVARIAAVPAPVTLQ